MEKNRIFLMLWGICAAFLWNSCGNRKQEKNALPPSKGLPYELLVVVDEELWNGAAGDSLRKDVTEAGMPGLPQTEPVFRTVRLYPRHFTRMYVTMRNILVVRTNPSLKTVKMGVARNVEAAPQTYVSVETPDAGALIAFLRTNKDRLTDVFVEAELRQECLRLEKKYNADVYRASDSIFGCAVKVPPELGALKKAEDFLWASTDRTEQDMNYVGYVLPWTEADVLLSGRWVELRDSVMRRNIPGSTPRQWMTTTREKGMPLTVQRGFRTGGHDVYEMRGLWEMHNGGIGGPFVSLALPDTARRRILVAEGFVYSPRTPKRDLLHRMEAALRTLSLRE